MNWFFVLLTAAQSSPECKNYKPIRQAFFGDTHVHTHLSLDANLQSTRTTPKQSYAFAKGAKISPTKGNKASYQLTTPLDFSIVTDHAEMLGEVEICTNPNLKGHYSRACKKFRANPIKAFIPMNFPLSQTGIFRKKPKRHGFCGKSGLRCRQAARKPWQQIQQAAHQAYEPCQFTSFVGYEWSGSPLTNSIHRNVVFSGETVPQLPISFFEAPRPAQLWEALDKQCRQQEGCDVLTIPHNSNLSGGKMFLPFKNNDQLLVYARKRAAFESLIEIFQHKGDSECGPQSPDELCQFEKLPYNNLTGNRFKGLLSGKPKRSDFVRQALKEGLLYAAKTGINPYQYGIIASSDTHLGTPGLVDAENYPGHGGMSDKLAKRLLPDDPLLNPGGLAVLWAEENTRTSLFAAMKRRESYGTSGPRIKLRFFAAPSLPIDICDKVDRISIGYNSGVPMGGILSPNSKPTFFVEAHQDKRRLQKIQIIKGWLAEDKLHEQVIDLYDSTTGQPNVCIRWEDPNPSQHAFYYARVLEEPSLRWTAYRCQQANIDCTSKVSKLDSVCCDPKIPKWIQERAWSSPIWTTSLTE